MFRPDLRVSRSKESFQRFPEPVGIEKALQTELVLDVAQVEVVETAFVFELVAFLLDKLTSDTPGELSAEEADAFCLLMTAKPPDEFTAPEISVIERVFPAEWKGYAEFHEG
jgi:hypothetical protein